MASEGIIDGNYNSLSKEDRAIVDILAEAKKIRQQLDFSNAFNSKF